jgi:hypothetical protein
MPTIFLPDEISKRAAAIATIKEASVPEILVEAVEQYFQGMDKSDRELVGSILRRHAENATARRANILPSESGQREVRYESTRLTFRRNAITTLVPEGLICIKTPHGTFEMTRLAFENEFSNVLSSGSYQRHGVYHYPTVPEKAKKYLKRSTTI